MTLARPTLLRTIALMTLVLGAAVLPATAAAAHNGTGGSSGDYRVEITGFDGDATGVELHAVELGNRLEVRRTTAASVMILGYDGEPYLRLDAAGVAENENSPAHYLNLDRFASTTPPASATATAAPAWVVLSTGSTVRWHDHRAHWMSTTPRADVIADPDVERVIFDAQRIEMVVDGRDVAGLVRVTWLPPPNRSAWLAAAAVLALGLGAVFVLLHRARGLLPVMAVAGAAAVLLAQGDSSTRHVLGVIVVVVAAVGAIARSPLVSIGATVAAGVLAATRLEVFEHELLAGWVGGGAQRISMLFGLAMCVGIVSAAIVGALEPTPPARPSTGESSTEPPALVGTR